MEKNPVVFIWSPEKPNIICVEEGHIFHALNYIFARDGEDKAFRGTGWHAGSKRERLFCHRCTTIIEVEVCPPVEVRKPAMKAIATASGD